MRARRVNTGTGTVVNTGTGTVPPSYVRMGGTVPVPMFTTNLRPEICHSLCRRTNCRLVFCHSLCRTTNLRLAICHSLCRRTNLRLTICHSLCRRTNLWLAICHSLCRRTNLWLTICHSLCRRTNRKHWDRHRSPFQRPYGGNDACPYVHGTVLVPMFTLSLCSRNGASLFTVRC